MGTQTATEAIKERLRTLTGAARSGGTKDMAELIGQPLANVTRYVHGAVTPPHDFLAQVADRYKVSLDWLYGRSERGGVADAEQQEPAWARRLDARLRFLERKLTELQASQSPAAVAAVLLTTSDGRELIREMERQVTAELAASEQRRDGAATAAGAGTQDET